MLILLVYLSGLKLLSQGIIILRHAILTFPTLLTSRVGDDSSWVKHQASDGKVADLWFDSRTGNALLCSWERHLTLISHRGQAVHPLWWPSLTKDLQTEPKKVLCIGVVRQG